MVLYIDSETERLILGNIQINTIVILGFIIASTIFYFQRYLEIRNTLELKSIEYTIDKDIALITQRLSVDEMKKVIIYYDDTIKQIQDRLKQSQLWLQDLKFVYMLLALSFIIVVWTMLSVTTELQSSLFLTLWIPVILFIINLILTSYYFIIIIKKSF